MAYNTVAEIPGSDKLPEVVMVGAHLDSWHSGTGATDNGAGSVVAMEAMRILKAIGAKPRQPFASASGPARSRASWARAATWPSISARGPSPPTPSSRALPRSLRKAVAPLTIKPEHARFSVYFNLDNGTGKVARRLHPAERGAPPDIRGLAEAVRRPRRHHGAPSATPGHRPPVVRRVGLPGLPVHPGLEADYASRARHHTNMDVYDRLQREDLMQAAVVMASFASTRRSACRAAACAGGFGREPRAPALRGWRCRDRHCQSTTRSTPRPGGARRWALAGRRAGYDSRT